MYTKTIILGRIGKLNDLKYSASGKAMISLSIATSKKIKGEEKTAWHSCKAFGKTAEFISNNFHKGKQILIDGEPQDYSYEKDGQKYYGYEVIINTVSFAGPKTEQEAEQPQQSFASTDIPF